MMFKEIFAEAFPVIEKLAPSIAGAIGSPVASAATMFGINLLGNALNVNPVNVRDVAQAVLTDPDAQGKISDLETMFAQWFKGHQCFKMPAKAEINVKLEWAP
jgi:hypothetical protein